MGLHCVPRPRCPKTSDHYLKCCCLSEQGKSGIFKILAFGASRTPPSLKMSEWDLKGVGYNIERPSC